MRKTYFVSAVVAASALVAVGGAALAAGGGFGGPGTTKFNDVSASAQLIDSAGAGMYISVDRGMQTFKLRGVAGPPVMVGPETVLNYSSYGADGSFIGGGCFVIPDSRFQVAGNLSAATLTVDPSVETPCPGFSVPADAGGRPGLGDVVPNAGGGGGGGGDPITANLTWTSNGAVMSFSFTSGTKCQGATSHATGSSASTFAAVSGTTSGISDFSVLYAQIGTFDNIVVVNSTFSNACLGI